MSAGTDRSSWTQRREPGCRPPRRRGCAWRSDPAAVTTPPYRSAPRTSAQPSASSVSWPCWCSRRVSTTSARRRASPATRGTSPRPRTPARERRFRPAAPEASGVTDLAGVCVQDIQLDGHPVNALAFHRVRGAIRPSIVKGRALRQRARGCARCEDLLRALSKKIADTMHFQFPTAAGRSAAPNRERPHRGSGCTSRARSQPTPSPTARAPRAPSSLPSTTPPARRSSSDASSPGTGQNSALHAVAKLPSVQAPDLPARHAARTRPAIALRIPSSRLVSRSAPVGRAQGSWGTGGASAGARCTHDH